jgi:CRP/FNR family transcriptional regulator, cyclic AMP receptor protein
MSAIGRGLSWLAGGVVERMAKRERRHPESAPRVRSATWSYIRGLRLFDVIPRDRIEAVVEKVRILEYPRRHQVMLVDRSEEVYVVAGGLVKLCRADRLGRRLIEGILEPGDLFGTVATPRDPAEYFLDVVDDTRILAVERAAFLELIGAIPEFSCRVVQLVEDRERVLRRRVESLLFKDVGSRVVETLIDLSREYGEPCPHGMALDVRITQQDLADLVGASRQMVNRVLRELMIKLYLVRKGRYLCILSMERLARLADGGIFAGATTASSRRSS